MLSVDMCAGRHMDVPRPKIKQLSQGPLNGASVTRDRSGHTFSVSKKSSLFLRDVSVTRKWQVLYTDFPVFLGSQY